MPRLIDLTGQRFGRLVVVRRSGTKGTDVAWRCTCDCGGEVVTRGVYLRTAKTQSCGCYRDEMILVVRRTHGASAGRRKTPTYRVWKNMKQRCCNPNNPRFADYGGRGISVCDRWLNDYSAFLADMGERPPGMSLDRRDNSLGYSKDNCHWTTAEKQARNSRWNTLTQQAVDEIRRQIAAGKRECEIVRALGLSRSAISAVIQGRTWR